jgi:nucleotide-binding universal stress UspA family protein
MDSPNLESATILVPVDFDEASLRAVSLAVDYARVFRGRVVVLHVVPPTSLPEGTRVLPVDGSDPVDLTEYVSARARRLLEDHFVSVLTSGAEVRREARSGHPVETILRAIDECGAKLVIVGTHGRKGASRLVFGSVAESVLRRSPVPVMIVRAPGSEVDRPAEDRSYVGETALRGGVAGAATGALLGPAGAVAGGVIGTAVGALAGDAADRARHA